MEFYLIKILSSFRVEAKCYGHISAIASNTILSSNDVYQLIIVILIFHIPEFILMVYNIRPQKS